MDVVDWLRALDLGQYEEAFRENLVSMDLLPSLTADDLKELGVNTVGDRRRPSQRCASAQNRIPQGRPRVFPTMIGNTRPNVAS
jgi:hypothetical protein